MTVDESLLSRARDALAAAVPAGRRRPPVEFDVATALEELATWLADDRESGSVFAAHWASLLDDVLWSIEHCGPRLTVALVVAEADAVAELKACRSSLRGMKGAPDRAMRRRISTASIGLRDRLLTGPAIRAAFDDVLFADGPTQSKSRAELFAAVASHAGHGRRWFISHLRSILADDAFAITAERGEALPDDPHAKAGASADERLAIVRSVLEEPALRGHTVVWLRYAHAKLEDPPTLRLGDAVTLFDDRWLRRALQHEPEVLTELAPDVDSEEKAFDVRLLVGDEAEPGTPDTERIVYVRISVPGVTASEGLRAARLTADAVAGLASLHGTPPRLWELDDSYVVRAKDGSGATSFGGLSHVQLDVEDEISLHDDHTGRRLADIADRLGPHLPVQDPAIANAATLLSWLRAARIAPPAPRLVLCGRVVEQVSGWAGFDDPRAFTTEILRPAWVVERLRRRVTDAAFVARNELHRLRRYELARAFVDVDDAYGGTVNLQAFLERINEIVAELAAAPRNTRQIASLEPLVRDPTSSASWFRSELKTFDRLESRRRRTRNSLVHGGPLAEGTIEATVDFAESLALRALGDCIEGRLSGEDLVDYFLARRANRASVQTRLSAGEPLSEALFWASPQVT